MNTKHDLLLKFLADAEIAKKKLKPSRMARIKAYMRECVANVKGCCQWDIEEGNSGDNSTIV